MGNAWEPCVPSYPALNSVSEVVERERREGNLRKCQQSLRERELTIYYTENRINQY